MEDLSMSFKLKLLVIHLTLLLSFKIYAFDEESSGESLKMLAKSDMCEGLSQLREVSQILEKVIHHLADLTEFKMEYFEKTRPAFQENSKLAADIERDLAELEKKETNCTFLELHSKEPCPRIINLSLRAPINEKIVRHNKKSRELAPSLERWRNESISINKQVELIEAGYQRAKETLEDAATSYWGAAVVSHFTDGRKKIEGVLKKPLDVDDEQHFLICLHNALDMHMMEVISEIKDWLQPGKHNMRWYPEKTEKRLTTILEFYSPDCIKRFDVTGFLDTLILCKNFPSQKG